MGRELVFLGGYILLLVMFSVVLSTEAEKARVQKERRKRAHHEEEIEESEFLWLSYLKF